MREGNQVKDLRGTESGLALYAERSPGELSSEATPCSNSYTDIEGSKPNFNENLLTERDTYLYPGAGKLVSDYDISKEDQSNLDDSSSYTTENQ